MSMKSNLGYSLLSIVGLVTLASGCTRTVVCLAPDGCGAEGGGWTETGGETGGETETGGPIDDDWGDPQLNHNKDIDILFVIDNSGSMGEEQAILATSIPALIAVLESPEVDANYRIGITTTDNGNDWCPVGTTTPEGGKLVLSSCTTRLGDFVFGNSVDVQDLACNDICALDAAELEILPTATDYDDVVKPRPWIERIEGIKNIPESTNTSDAFACFAPQGVNGCGFESQLESMYLALVRAQSPDEASFGFLRRNALLAVVIVTDEADCSYNKEWASIFSPDGNKVFWSDPTADFPSSAVCWNAGVECVGDPSGYDSCDSANKDVLGNVGVSDADAVLHPMNRYLGLLQGLEAEKQQLNADQEVIVALIGGVGASGEAVYADIGGLDPTFQADYGIGPGCEAPNPLDPGVPVRAVPPVRLRELTEAFTPQSMFSICEPDYAPAFESIVQRITDQIQPICYPLCVEDADPATEFVEPECTVAEDPPGLGEPIAMAECLRDGSGAYAIDPQTNDYTMPTADTNVCYALLTDKGGQTSDPNDDMSAPCLDQNNNLEFKIVRRQGFPAIGGTSITAECLLAEFPEVTCG